jgi:hypothetical protein
VLEGTLQEAGMLSSKGLQAEHVLLSLTADRAPDAASQLLEQVGVAADALRHDVLRRLSRSSVAGG